MIWKICLKSTASFEMRKKDVNSPCPNLVFVHKISLVNNSCLKPRSDRGAACSISSLTIFLLGQRKAWHSSVSFLLVAMKAKTRS